MRFDNHARRLLAFVLISSCCSFGLIAPLTAAEGENLTTTVVQPFLDRHELAGAVTVVLSKSQIQTLETVGYADIAAHRPMRADTLFWLASSSKPFLATAVMMLVDEGKIRLDDPVDHYLPEFAPRVETLTTDRRHVVLQKPSHPITVRNLLNHTSGFGFVLSQFEAEKIDSLPLTAKVDVYTLEPLVAEPGARWNYSNNGFETAARIVEVVSGVSLATFMQQRIFGPLNMVDTTYLPTEAQVARLAKGYQINADRSGLEEVPIALLQYPLANNPKRFASSSGGGLFSTAVDLARYCRMILNGGTLDGKRFLSSSAIEEMTRKQVKPQLLTDGKLPLGWDNYGLGWQLLDGTFGMEGAFGTNIKFYPKQDRAVIWLIQTPDPMGVGRASRGIFEKAVERR